MAAAVAIAVAAAVFTDAPEHVSSQARRPARTARASARRAAPARYSQFPHDIAAHKKDCVSCHKFPSSNWSAVRAKADAFPDVTEYPEHQSCVGCHRQQFFKGARPAICSICHVNPSPRDSRRHLFANPREAFDLTAKGRSASSDFAINFPHATHIGIVSGLRRTGSPFINASFSPARADESCAVCHKTMGPQGETTDEYATKPPAELGDAFWLKKGTFKSAPTGHTLCFTCHSADSGMNPAPTSCATCHSLKPKQPAADFDAALASRMAVTERVTLDAWRRRDSSGTFRHEFSSHADMECATCHNAEKMNTLDHATKRVGIASCAMCHVTASVDDGGAVNYEVDQRRKNGAFQCVKCHISFGKMPIPESHLNAIKEAGGK